MSANKIIVMDTAEALHVRAAEEIAHVAGESICTHGEFTLALTGGSTPAPTYELLATRFHLSVDWKEVQFFWGDERCVPPDDPASNYGMANRTMLSKLALRPEQVHRIRGEDSPAQAAEDYERELRRCFGLDGSPDDFPSFNLVLLGLGDNAHVASLFPRHPALLEASRLAVAVEVEAEPPKRVSLTMPVINAAQQVILIVSGEKKAAAVRNVLQGTDDPEQYPAQYVKGGEILWLLDKPAASMLK
ncbi:MAG TPA: 6-phosphogluconolactonase [Candidatus Binataceae bacterium]|nr:6-phosphogluconolactonase [Candidatus Binataceae bacterium]